MPTGPDRVASLKASVGNPSAQCQHDVLQRVIASIDLYQGSDKYTMLLFVFKFFYRFVNYVLASPGRGFGVSLTKMQEASEGLYGANAPESTDLQNRTMYLTIYTRYICYRSLADLCLTHK